MPNKNVWNEKLYPWPQNYSTKKSHQNANQRNNTKVWKVKIKIQHKAKHTRIAWDSCSSMLKTIKAQNSAYQALNICNYNQFTIFDKIPFFKKTDGKNKKSPNKQEVNAHHKISTLEVTSKILFIEDKKRQY